jgi:hypothetical protein
MRYFGLFFHPSKGYEGSMCAILAREPPELRLFFARLSGTRQDPKRRCEAAVRSAVRCMLLLASMQILNASRDGRGSECGWRPACRSPE